MMPPPISAATPTDQAVEDRISAGVRTGIITVDQAAQLRQLPLDAPARDFAVALSGDEPFALFRGFRDVFLALGLIILASGIVGTSVEVFGFSYPTSFRWTDVGILASWAGLAWLVAEWITARLRMPLASLVLCAMFSFATGAMVATALLLFELLNLGQAVIGRNIAPFIALGALAFYARFRLPFSMLLVAGPLTYWAYSVTGSADTFRLFAALAGLAIFAVAVSYELRDPTRSKRQSENAFWLHLLAAPLIVYALTGGDGVGIMQIAGVVETGEAVRIFLIVFVLGLIALVIDRRAFIVAALFYLAGAIAYTFSQSGLPIGMQAVATALVIGVLIVALALGWQPLRRALLGLLPQDLAMRLPNPANPDAQTS
ncbi:MAG: hypothetical protein AAF590_04630 [Pseudomonadota bacterium]